MKKKNDPDFIKYLDEENSYADTFMDDTKNLQHVFYSEMTAREPSNKFTSPPQLSGPWYYYEYIPESKDYSIYCRKLATETNDWFQTPSNHVTGKSSEVQILLDYNELVEQYGYVDVGTHEVSPNHNYLAYTLDTTGDERFMLQVKNLKTGILENFRVDDVDDQVECYTPEHDPINNIMIYTEKDPKFSVDISSTKDKNYITVNSKSKTSSKVYVIDANNVKSGLHRIQKRVPGIQYRLEHHHHGFFYALTDRPLSRRKSLATGNRYVVRCPVQDVHKTRWETVLVPGEDVIIKDIDIFNEYLVLELKRNGFPVMCSIKLPIDGSSKKAMKNIDDLDPWYFPLPSNLCTIVPGSNYDFMSSRYRADVSSPMMSDVIVDYDMSKRSFSIVDHDEVVGTTMESNSYSISEKGEDIIYNDGQKWSDFSEAYCIEEKEVISHDGIRIPLTILYSRKTHNKEQSPGLLKGYGAYGDVLDKSWSSDRQSLLDRGWVVAFADVRGGGIRTDPLWHKYGRGSNKSNSIADFVSCAEYLISEGYVHKRLLGALGGSAGGLLVAAAANRQPELFRAIILEVPFLDVCNTLLDPCLSSLDCVKEFGNPEIRSEFFKILKYSPYDNVPKQVCCPAMLVTASFNDSRVGVWEPAKWVAKVRKNACSECSKAVILKTNMKCGHLGEPWTSSRYQETAYKYAFLVKVMGLMDT
ncbi:Prolyl endopeptidase [Heracleum sosnowskyi]|uniref:Prolyl endopeptidase n=1 Tax=Heracleum sosnowskyi TaxID=360622 RepID=A0AAD8H8I3_9APIA|nr:Prolyl endopeptidase [Heracleum sosnowskyi]